MPNLGLIGLDRKHEVCIFLEREGDWRSLYGCLYAMLGVGLDIQEQTDSVRLLHPLVC